MYRIYIDNDMSSETYSTELLYSPDRTELADGHAVYDISIDKELNSAGSAKFTVPVSNKKYGDIEVLRTMVFAYWDASLIWVGRVLSITYDIYRNKMVSCEGCLAFLNDIYIKPFLYGGASTTRTLSQHFSNIIAIYNNRCSQKRVFSSISTDFPDEFLSSDTYKVSGVTSYKTVKEELENLLSVNSSVAMSVVYEGLGMPTLIFAKTPFRTVRNLIKFGRNLLDFNYDNDGSGIFTSVIPLGDDNIVIDDENYAVQSSSLVQKYGVIERTVQLDGVKDRTYLQEAGESIMNAAALGDHPDITIKAVDLCWIDPTSAPEFIEVGDAVPIENPLFEINHYYLCTKISFDFENPADTSYTFSYTGEAIPSHDEYKPPPEHEVTSPAYMKEESSLSNYVLNTEKSIAATEQADVQRPDSISVSSNEVTISYPGYEVTYQADGTGSSRSNVRSSVSVEE